MSRYNGVMTQTSIVGELHLEKDQFLQQRSDSFRAAWSSVPLWVALAMAASYPVSLLLETAFHKPHHDSLFLSIFGCILWLLIRQDAFTIYELAPSGVLFRKPHKKKQVCRWNKVEWCRLEAVAREPRYWKLEIKTNNGTTLEWLTMYFDERQVAVREIENFLHNHLTPERVLVR